MSFVLLRVFRVQIDRLAIEGFLLQVLIGWPPSRPIVAQYRGLRNLVFHHIVTSLPRVFGGNTHFDMAIFLHSHASTGQKAKCYQTHKKRL